MKHYELAYEVNDEKNLIIPHLLKEDRPEQLPDFPMGESLMLRYVSEDILPSNTISRFIVRHNQQIKKYKKDYLVWRYGVILEDLNGNLALVREEDRILSISVKGSTKTDYLSLLRETLNDIFNSYKSNKPQLEYRIEQFGQIPSELEKKNPLWLEESQIFTQAQDNVPFYNHQTKQYIPMQKTVHIYNIDKGNLLQGVQDSQFIAGDLNQTIFNFHDCNISLQGNLNELAGSLVQNGHKEQAKELENIANALEQVEQCQDKNEIKKKGIGNKLKRFTDELVDKDSQLHKTIKGIKHGVSIAQDIAKGYNDLAQWAGLPQVPKPFLKKES